jgi:hypothetical protein
LKGTLAATFFLPRTVSPRSHAPLPLDLR